MFKFRCVAKMQMYFAQLHFASSYIGRVWVSHLRAKRELDLKLFPAMLLLKSFKQLCNNSQTHHHLSEFVIMYYCVFSNTKFVLCVRLTTMNRIDCTTTSDVAGFVSFVVCVDINTGFVL